MWANLGFSPGLGFSGITGNFRNTSCVVESPAVNIHDTELIEACLAGKTDAFGQLVVRHQDRLYNTLVKVLGSADDARDVVREAFVHAFQKLHTFRGNSAFYSWLYRIAFNAAVTKHRKRGRQAASIDAVRQQTGAEPVDTSPETEPAHKIEQSERQQAVRTALSQLSEEFRTVLVLKEMEGLKYEQIAEIVDCPVGTVRSRIYRARVELRDRLKRILKEEDW